MPAARSWPQFVRIVVKHDPSGVSVVSWTLVLANFTMWATYGVVSELPVLIVANVLAGLGSAGIVVSLGRHGLAHRWQAPAAVAAALAGASAVYLALGATALLSVATVMAVGMFLPQLWTVFKTEPSGVSPLTWWLGVLAGVVWLGYGFTIGQPEIAAPHAVMTPCALAILWRVYTYDRVTQTAAGI